MRDIVYIAIAGSLGAISRYYIGLLALRHLGNGFPYGTLAVNLTGSFLAGLIMQLCLSSDFVPHNLRLAATLGFLGAFTTFSTFSYETLSYIENGAWLTAGLNILLNVLPGILAAFLGVTLGRIILNTV